MQCLVRDSYTTDLYRFYPWCAVLDRHINIYVSVRVVIMELVCYWVYIFSCCLFSCALLSVLYSLRTLVQEPL